MPDLADRLNDAREAITGMDPPADLWARVVERASTPDVAAEHLPVEHLPVQPSSSYRSRWIAVAAIAAVVAIVFALVVADDDDEQSVDTRPATNESTTTTTLPLWSGPIRDPSVVVQRMAVDELFGADPPNFGRTWPDARDAAEELADIVEVHYRVTGTTVGNIPNPPPPYDKSRGQYSGRWEIALAGAPPSPEEIEPGVLIAYGFVLDTTGDGAADYVIGLDNDAPVRGDFHAWVTNLATGQTDAQVAAPYGIPIDFTYPREPEPNSYPVHPTMSFHFNLGSAPADLDLNTVRFYAWTAVTRSGVVLDNDYAPDTGWITSGQP